VRLDPQSVEEPIRVGAEKRRWSSMIYNGGLEGLIDRSGSRNRQEICAFFTKILQKKWFMKLLLF